MATQRERKFRCMRCQCEGGIDAFQWSRRLGVWCRRCRRYTYVIAEVGPSPYLDWPFKEAPLSPGEILTLFQEARDGDLLFLSLEDWHYYQEHRVKGRTQPSWRRAVS